MNSSKSPVQKAATLDLARLFIAPFTYIRTHIYVHGCTWELCWHKNACLTLSRIQIPRSKWTRGTARPADSDLPWTTAVFAAPTLALCHEIHQHGSKRIQEAAFSICPFLVWVCVWVGGCAKLAFCVSVWTVSLRSGQLLGRGGAGVQTRLNLWSGWNHTQPIALLVPSGDKFDNLMTLTRYSKK